MRNRHWTLLALGGALAFVALRAGIGSGEPAPAGKVADFTLPDSREQVRVSLADFRDKKAVVLVFLGTECPLNNAYLPRLAELHEEFAGKGVQFLGINSNSHDTAGRVAEHARKHQLPFPVLKDAGSAVADQAGARRTPEVVVLDAARAVRYRGRIDDQFGVGYQRPKPTRRDLAESLTELLAGQPVSRPQTEVEGCLIARTVKPKAGGPVTYTKQVARVLQNHCQECHRPGMIGPMPLLSYDDAAAWSATIREVVQQERMPPWYADAKHGEFTNDRRLPKEDREALLAWINDDCPKGDDKDLPPPRQFVEGWRIGEPDLVLNMPEEFAVPARAPRGGVPYQHFAIKTNFKEDRWVVRAEARPGAADVVHHIVVFVVLPGLHFEPKIGNAPVLCGTAPGDMPLILKPGLAKRIPAGSDLVLQMHYTPTGTARKDRSSVGLIFAKEPPEHRVRTFPIANPVINIPPGKADYEVESWFSFPRDGHILSFMPHMHLRGKDFRVEAIHPDGSTEVLLNIPRYNFNWQSVYRYAEPVAALKGTKIHCVAHFDNSDRNRNNPDPTKWVRWGDQTWEEMMIGWMDFVYDEKAE